MSKFQPAIKWSGSKRSQSEAILKHFPREINTYYEPFCGGASVLRQLLSKDNDILVNNYVCSDINKGLIDLWNLIKSDPIGLSESYCNMWHEMNDTEDIEFKKQYFYKIRERYNKYHSPYDFMFIMRTTTNGMPRYNLSGEFNNSFHVTRKGIQPSRLQKHLIEWSDLLNENNVQFIHQDYSKIKSLNIDLIYLDPPYANTKGMYYGAIDYLKLWNWIDNQNGKVLLSFDGKTSTEDFTQVVPEGLFDSHEYLYSGNSSFRRVIGTSNKEYVSESLYVRGSYCYDFECRCVIDGECDKCQIKQESEEIK